MAQILITSTIAAPIETVFDVARDIGFHQESLRHTSERAVAGRTDGLIELSETVTWRARHLGVWWTLTSRVTELSPPELFVDEQVAGPFRSFRHEHRFQALPQGTLMIDDWRHVAPLGWLGQLVDGVVLRRWMERVLSTRAAAIAQEAERRATSLRCSRASRTGRSP